MDIRTPEAIMLAKRFAEGKMLLVPEGARDVERNQLYGATTEGRFFRLDEAIGQYNVLAATRDRFEAVRNVHPGETIRADSAISNVELLPPRTFGERCWEEGLNAVCYNARNIALGYAMGAGVNYLWVHLGHLFGALRAMLFSGYASVHLDGFARSVDAQNLGSNAQVAGRASGVFCGPDPQTLGWQDARPGMEALASGLGQAARPGQADGVGLALPVLTGAALASTVHYAVRNQSQQSGERPQQ